MLILNPSGFVRALTLPCRYDYSITVSISMSGESESIDLCAECRIFHTQTIDAMMNQVMSSANGLNCTLRIKHHNGQSLQNHGMMVDQSMA